MYNYIFLKILKITENVIFLFFNFNNFKDYTEWKMCMRIHNSMYIKMTRVQNYE